MKETMEHTKTSKLLENVIAQLGKEDTLTNEDVFQVLTFALGMYTAPARKISEDALDESIAYVIELYLSATETICEELDNAKQN